MKKTAAVILTAALLLFLVTGALAAGGKEFSEQAFSIKAEMNSKTGEVELGIDLNDKIDLNGFSFNVEYDSDKLTADRFEPGEALSGQAPIVNMNFSENSVRAVFASAYNLEKNGRILNFCFKVKDGKSGNAIFRLVEIKTTENGEKSYCEDLSCYVTLPEAEDKSSSGKSDTGTSSHGGSSGKSSGGSTITIPAVTDENTSNAETADKPFDEMNFGDVSESDWFYPFVSEAYGKKWMQGVSESEFDPEGNVTRAMFVTVLYRISGAERSDAACPFKDVEQGQWYSDAVLWAYENKIVSGISEDEFEPDSPITREQMVTILYRYNNSPKAEETKTEFADGMSISDYAVSAVSWAVDKKILSGYEDGTVRPQNMATRAETAAIFVRAFE